MVETFLSCETLEQADHCSHSSTKLSAQNFSSTKSSDAPHQVSQPVVSPSRPQKHFSKLTQVTLTLNFGVIIKLINPADFFGLYNVCQICVDFEMISTWVKLQIVHYRL